MEEILHQLRLVVYPIIYKVLYIPGGFLAGFLNHQQYVSFRKGIPGYISKPCDDQLQGLPMNIEALCETQWVPSTISP